MNRISWKVTVMVVALFILGGVIGWSIGNPDRAGYVLQIKALQAELANLQEERDWLHEELVSNSPYVTIYPSEQDSDGNAEWEREILDRFIDGIDTANITIEFDNSGYAKGFISIYYNRPIKTILWLEPEHEYKTWNDWSDNYTE